MENKNFIRETECIALKDAKESAFVSRDISSNERSTKY